MSSATNEGGTAGVLLEALLAFGLIAAILIALADTKFYGLAFAIAGLSLLYVLLSHPSIATHLAGIVSGAAGKLGPSQGASS